MFPLFSSKKKKKENQKYHIFHIASITLLYIYVPCNQVASSVKVFSLCHHVFCFASALVLHMERFYCYFWGDDVHLLFDRKVIFWIDSHQVCRSCLSLLCAPCSNHGSVSQLSSP